MNPQQDSPNPRSKPSTPLVQRYGPWAVVTGASAGIGEAVARRLADQGMNLVLVARSADQLHGLAAELSTSRNIQTLPVSLDLGAKDSARELEAATKDLDVGLLVAAAGFGTSGPFLSSSVHEELDMINVNCAAVLAQTHHFAQRFAHRKRGGIILLASIVGFQGNPFAANYAATKAYIQGLGEGLSVELKSSGVDVLTVAPGPTASGFADRAGLRMGSTDTPDQVARSILKAIGRKTTLLPSFRAKFLRGAVLTMPIRKGRVRIMGNIMKNMTKPTEPNSRLSK
jgi:uncharacterized protein